jgi:hypothetical protein
MSDFEEIELSTAVRVVREQLTQAALDGAGSPVQFEVGPIQMDFEVEIRREFGGKGAVKAWVVMSAEVGAKTSRETTHRVSFTLTPKDSATNGPYNIGNADPGRTSRFGGTGN